jgi:tetratricopeptide (TPR) repeat protein
MPPTSCHLSLLRPVLPERARSFSSSGTAALLLTLIALAPQCGCHIFHCAKSDEAVSAARDLSLRGIDAQQKGQVDRAEELFAAAVQRCPQDERARCGYAEVLWQRGAQDEAVAHMEEAVRLSGSDPQRRVQLGKMYLARGQVHQASVQADKAIAANREWAAAWALHGDVLRAEGLRSEALASYHRALSIQAHYPEVQLALADLYGQQNRPQRALSTLEALAEHYPPDQVPADVSYREGLVLRGLGRHQDAVERLAAAVKRGPATPDMLYELAQTQILAGDRTAASQSVTAGLAMHPNHTGLNRLQGELGSREETVAQVSDERVIR